MSVTTLKPWLQAPEFESPTHVLIIGAGIAGATTAHALAVRGIHVTVLDSGLAASGASGNHQGLLYAKITAAQTAQNQLLKQAYPFALAHLQQYFQAAQFWQSCGLLQLAFDEAEAVRQHKLLATDYPHIQAFSSPEQQGLWWPQGAWVSPPLWIAALLEHPNIQVLTHQTVSHFVWDQVWHVHTHNKIFETSHLIVCAGHRSDGFTQTQALALRSIRGQVGYANHSPLAPEYALNGQHYLTPAFQNRHTFGASFVPDDNQFDFRMAEHQHNLDGLKQLLPQVAAQFSEQKPQGRASIRADSIDHLPIVGPVGDAQAMRSVYAKLMQDKNYPIDSKCPYHENLWVNTAHGTRGMVTAPLCAESLARRLCHQSDVLPVHLQAALHPNRLPIRQLIYARHHD